MNPIHRNIRRAAFAALTLAPALLASDTVLVHGHIYTQNPASPWAEAIAVTAGRIDAIGSDADIARNRTTGTKVVDLGGRTVIPGFIDIHTHMFYGALALHGFNFSTPEYNITPNDEDAFVDAIRVYALGHRDEKILFGRASFSTAPNSNARLELLDRAVPDRPLVIHATSEHALWVNSKTLALAGITDKPAADPKLERFIVRDSKGHPTGVFRESSMHLINSALPIKPLEERVALMRDAAHYLNSFGITGAVEVTGDPEELEAFSALKAKGELSLRVRMAYGKVGVNHHLTPDFLEDLDKARKANNDEWLSANLVKLFSDGVGNPPPMFYDPADYRKLVIELDKRGYQLVTHAIGADAAHMVLEAYQELERTNGPRDRRLRMEHLFALIPSDLPRFASMSVVAGFQPAFCCNSASGAPGNQWGTIEKSDAMLSFSSDWPCSWPPNPILSIQEAVEREVRRPVTLHGGTSGAPAYAQPEERVTVEQAMKAYSQAGAYAAFWDKFTGTLETGKQADLAVLSGNIFTAQKDQIANSRVLLTMVGGKVVYTTGEMTPPSKPEARGKLSRSY